MAINNQMPVKKAGQKLKIRTRMSIPILLVVVFQLLAFFAVLFFGGEFKNIRDYAYSTLVEKTENRSTYIRNDLRTKPILVQEYAEEINGLVAGILEERGASIADIQTDKELNHLIIESSMELVTSLLRRSLANDVYLILETGDLYADEGGEAKAGLCLRDLDPNSGSGYDDLLMEMGFATIALDLGITRNYGWTQYFKPDPADTVNFDFYYRTIETARENSHLATNLLGYWSEFSKLAPMSSPSMKYTLPLIARDGTIYGVLGIGLMENAILTNIPSNDFLSETACYVLGHSRSEGVFGILTHSGHAFDSLLGRYADTLHVSGQLEEDIYRFDTDMDMELLGSFQYFGLYNQHSPYSGERWALISVAEKSSVLRPVTFLVQMLMASALASLLVATVVAVLSCAGFIQPITAAIRQMKVERKFNEVIHFQPSNIYEIDEMTDAITQLQINVQSVSSEVSKMISIADVGLGTFRHDRGDDSVFVGQSLIPVLGLELPRGEDIVMPREEFLDSIKNAQVRAPIAAGLELAEGETRDDRSQVYRIHMADGSTRWMRLGFTYSTNTTVGVVQDVTDTMMEKQRIEYERDYDSLTGLMNRHAYSRRVEALFDDREKLNITAFIMIDLDNLKYVNDTYGHDFGDDYIKTAATILKKFENDGGVVSRISGDEFRVCLPGFPSKEAARAVIRRVRDEFMQGSCLLSDGTHFKLSGSLGVSWYPDDADSYPLLMKYADFAMYTVKHSAKGGIAEFNKDSYSEDSALLTGVEEMNRIFKEQRIKSAFQSIVSAKTGEIYGYEALMRVQSEIFQSPLELLRTARTDGKIYEIERLTFAKSLADFQALVDAGHVEETAHIFINSIADCELAGPDMGIIEAAHRNLMPRVVLEILENGNANETFTAHKKAYMEERNAQVALNNFGTGYNSEYALLHIQPNIIKIDRSIVSGCDRDLSRRMIIGNLVKLARTKNILVVAKGVETKEELETVIACGVDLLQGYYLAYPQFQPQPLDGELAKTIRDLAGALGEGPDEV